MFQNEKVYQKVAEQLATHGYQRTFQQCREKLKKLKSDYRAIKDHNGRSGSNRRKWKWFNQMDAIYGHRPANNGRKGGLDSATALLQAIVDDSKLFFYVQLSALCLKASFSATGSAADASHSLS